MPKHDHFLPQVVSQGIVHVAVAIAAGKNHYAKLHESVFIDGCLLRQPVLFFHFLLVQR
jgi:hypothetical protein